MSSVRWEGQPLQKKLNGKEALQQPFPPPEMYEHTKSSRRRDVKRSKSRMFDGCKNYAWEVRHIDRVRDEEKPSTFLPQAGAPCRKSKPFCVRFSVLGRKIIASEAYKSLPERLPSSCFLSLFAPS